MGPCGPSYGRFSHTQPWVISGRFVEHITIRMPLLLNRRLEHESCAKLCRFVDLAADVMLTLAVTDPCPSLRGGSPLPCEVGVGLQA